MYYLSFYLFFVNLLQNHLKTRLWACCEAPPPPSFQRFASSLPQRGGVDPPPGRGLSHSITPPAPGHPVPIPCRAVASHLKHFHPSPFPTHCPPKSKAVALLPELACRLTTLHTNRWPQPSAQVWPSSFGHNLILDICHSTSLLDEDEKSLCDGIV